MVGLPCVSRPVQSYILDLKIERTIETTTQIQCAVGSRGQQLVPILCRSGEFDSTTSEHTREPRARLPPRFPNSDERDQEPSPSRIQKIAAAEMDVSYTDPSSQRRDGAQLQPPISAVVETTTSSTRGSKRAGENHSQDSTPKRQRPGVPEPGPGPTPHTPSDTTRSPASPLPGSACAQMLICKSTPRSYPPSLDTILVRVSAFGPPRECPEDALSAIVRGDDITRPLDDPARYPLEGFYISPADADRRTSFALIPDEREWRLFLTQLKTSGVPLDPNRYYNPTLPVSIRIWALPSGQTPQDVIAPVLPSVEVVDLLTDDELDPYLRDRDATNVLSGSEPDLAEPDLVEPEDGEAFEPGPIDPSIVEAVRRDMCKFFGIDPSDVLKPGFTHTPPGMKKGLRFHQLWAFFWVFASKAARGIATALLADEMGLGKTVMSLAVAVLSHRLRAQADHVSRHPDQHLTADDERTKCPSGTYTHGFQCPCEAGSWSARIAADLSHGPTVVFGSKLILRSWAYEFSKFVDASPDDGMILLTLPDDPAPVRSLIADIDIAKLPRGPPTSSKKPGLQDEGARLKPKPGQSRYILLIPNTSAVKSIDSTFAVTADRRRPPTVVQFAVQPGRIIVDEAHCIKGETTMLWDRIRRWQWRARSPTYLLALTGTPMTRDPADFERLVEHLNHPGAGWSSPLRPPATSTLQALKRLTSHYNKTLARGLGAAAAGSESESDQQQQQAFLSDLSALVLTFTLRRRRDDIFAGAPLSTVPMVPFNVVDCPPPPQFAACIENIFSSTKDEVQALLDERHARWEELPEHRRGTEPTFELLVRQISAGAPNTSSSFRLLRLCATFPALARLHCQAPYCDWSLTGEDFRGVFTKGTIMEARAKSKAWPFWRDICNGSTKMEQLDIQIRKMLADREPAHGTNDVVSDKKMLVYSDSPFVAHLAFLWIANTFDIPVQMVDRGMSAANRVAAIEPFVTVSLDRLRRECYHPTEPPSAQVLVTTVGIIAEGLNLARANYLVLLGPLGTVAKQLQIGCRINREGGFFTPHLTLLLDPDNKAEMVVRRRQLNRATIETEVWANTK
ncbi:P-loop containing nucleoside triphosphate hydrolase protein [Chaetomium tenue]|uniref:P-loop containing nucleoside triphosphate hydrolase protein n=2 Tax=Chaetomium tenue TaxID=1854479 RepID=A0ACB7PGN2_9PEZI|nr:P-loop containing nucleoside triphosphate hydrolase protein [Chaetomium globosum]KAH6641105.1 P-loop containing nucleoside triphosphate hydrolase protein [Chaetomium globosum]